MYLIGSKPVYFSGRLFNFEQSAHMVLLFLLLTLSK